MSSEGSCMTLISRCQGVAVGMSLSDFEHIGPGWEGMVVDVREAEGEDVSKHGLELDPLDRCEERPLSRQRAKSFYRRLSPPLPAAFLLRSPSLDHQVITMSTYHSFVNEVIPASFILIREQRQGLLATTVYVL